MLLATLRLVFAQEGPNTTAKGYIINPVKGMVLVWSVTNGVTPFPSPLDPVGVLSVVSAWLASKPDTECKDWDKDYDHEGRTRSHHGQSRCF